MLGFPWPCSCTCNKMFLRHKARSNIWFWWVTIFNLHNLPDHFPEGHVAMLSRLPELGATRLGQYKNRASTAGRCWVTLRLKLLSFWPRAGGRGTMGSPPSLVTILLLTHHGLNTSWCPLPSFCAANKSAYYMNLTQQTTGRFYATFLPVYVTTHRSASSRSYLEKKERKTYGLEGWAQRRVCFTHAWNETVLQSFGTLYAIKNINLATNTS